MSDLISRSALIRTIKRRKDVHKVEYAHDKRESDFFRCCECFEIERLVKESPTVDAVPVSTIEIAIDNIGRVARSTKNVDFINGCNASLVELYRVLKINDGADMRKKVD